LGGGKRWAITGALVGGLVGIFAGPFGMMAGGFVGALIGAWYEGKTGLAASQVALWTVVGIIGATVMQLLVAIGMIIAFIILAVG
jgi:uncharacterized protein YqgC (DUF456 family)